MTSAAQPHLRRSKHPKGLYLLASAQFWERFSYYGILGILVLYLTAPIDSGGLAWTKDWSVKVVGIFGALCFSLPAFGGFIADRWLGERRCITIGSLLIILGHIFLGIQAVPSIAGEMQAPLLYISLLAIALGIGFLKSTISSIVAGLYTDEIMKEEGYMIFLFFIYAGTLIAFLCVGAVGEVFGWHYGFSVAAVGMTFGYLVYALFAQTVLQNLGKKPNRDHLEFVDYRSDRFYLSNEEKKEVSLIFTFGFFTIIYTACYFQDTGLFSLFIDENTDRSVAGFLVPTPWFLTVGVFVFMIMTPLFAWTWRTLSAQGFHVDVLFKQALGFLILSIGFLIIAYGTRQGHAQPITALWFAGAYVCHGVADLLIWPPQLNATTTFAPRRYRSIFVGLWWVMAGAGIFLTGYVAKMAEPLGFSGFAFFLAAVCIVASVAVGLCRLTFRKLLQKSAASL